MSQIAASRVGEHQRRAVRPPGVDVATAQNGASSSTCCTAVDRKLTWPFPLRSLDARPPAGARASVRSTGYGSPGSRAPRRTTTRATPRRRRRRRARDDRKTPARRVDTEVERARRRAAAAAVVVTSSRRPWNQPSPEQLLGGHHDRETQHERPGERDLARLPVLVQHVASKGRPPRRPPDEDARRDVERESRAEPAREPVRSARWDRRSNRRADEHRCHAHRAEHDRHELPDVDAPRPTRATSP